jgi:hypothetical protein
MANPFKKSCGNCCFWIKWKQDERGRGLCGKHDWAPTASYSCSDWKGEKYNRTADKEKVLAEIKSELL